MHLVLRVQTDDALRIETETSADRFREQMKTRGVAGTVAAAASDGSGWRACRRIRMLRFATWPTRSRSTTTREPGVSGTYDFVLRPIVATQLRNESVRQALQTIERRVNELGVAEPIVALYGTGGDQILVQLPGVTDVARAKEIIRSTALLELKIVEDGPGPTREGLLATRGGVVPPDMEVLPGASDTGGTGTSATVYYLVRRVAAVTGRDLRTARPSLDQNNRPAVSFSLNQDGARKFGERDRREHRPQPGHRPRRPGRHPRRGSTGRISDEGQHLRHASPSRRCRTCRSCCGRARCRRR